MEAKFFSPKSSDVTDGVSPWAPPKANPDKNTAPFSRSRSEKAVRRAASTALIVRDALTGPGYSQAAKQQSQVTS